MVIGYLTYPWCFMLFLSRFSGPAFSCRAFSAFPQPQQQHIGCCNHHFFACDVDPTSRTRANQLALTDKGRTRPTSSYHDRALRHETRKLSKAGND